MKRFFLLLAILTSCVPAFAGWTPPVRISEAGWQNTVYNTTLIAISDSVLHVVEDKEAPDDSIRYQRSTDWGNNWLPSMVLPQRSITSGSWGPSLVARDSLIFVSWSNSDNVGPYYGNIAFRKSDNLGQSWSPSLKILAPDIENIPLQTMGQIDSFIYIIYHDYVSNTDTLRFNIVRSYDQGQTWSSPSEIFRGFYLSNMQTVGVGNTIHLAWSGELEPNYVGPIYYAKSTDGGLTWSDNIDLRQTNVNIGTAVDLARDEHGNLVACWMDYRFSPYMTTGDIFCRISTDTGQTWQDEIQLTNLHLSDSPKAAWQGNTIGVVYIDNRDYDSSREELYFRKSTNNGASWQDEERLTDDANDDGWPSLAILNERIFLTYSLHIPNGWDPEQIQGVYFRRYDPEPDEIGEGLNQPKDMALELAAYPNPFNSSTTISYYLPYKSTASLQIFNILGQQVYSKNLGLQSAGEHNISVDLAFCPSGIYFVRMETDRGYSNNIKILLLK